MKRRRPRGTWLLRATAIVVARLPWRLLWVPGACLGWLAGSLLRIRRAQVEGAMRSAGLKRPERVARAMYAALGRSLFEFLWLSMRGTEAAGHVVVDPPSREAWERALGMGRGVVIAASHTGNWDLAAAAAAREVELLVVTKHLAARALDRFWQSTRADQGVQLADAFGALSNARAVLRRGGAVAMMIDQVPTSPKHALGIEFLGRPALADRAPAALAAIAGSPLVVIASRAGARGSHVVHVLAVLEPPSPPRRAGPRWIAGATRSASYALETFVRAHPAQWLWLHRRWRVPRTADANVRSVAGSVDPSSRAATLVGRW